MTLLVPAAQITPVLAQTVISEAEQDAGYSIVEDMNSTTTNELFKIQYLTGDWAGGTSHPDLFHDGYEHYANGDASYSMKFIGTGVEIWASKNKAHGIYTVTIDGEDAGTADGSTTGSTLHQQKIYEKTDLADGEHTITVSFSGQSGKAIQLDYLKVYHNPITPSAIEFDQKNILLSPGASHSMKASFVPWVASGDLSWTSSDPSVVTVNDGVLQAADDLETAKTAVITASCGSVSASVNVTVDPEVLVYEPYTETHTALRSAFYAGSVPDNTWVFAGGRTTMGAFSDIRGTRNYVRLLEEYWRYDGRHRNNMSVNNYRAYMHNTAAAGESLADTVAKFDSIIRPLNPRYVSYMIDEEDFSKGKEGLAQFKADLQTLIDQALSLRGGTDSFLAVATPWARLDPAEKNNAARYAMAAREVIDAQPAEKRNRIMIADVFAKTDTSSFAGYVKEDGSLKNTAHLQIANAISSVVYGSGKISLSDRNLTAFTEIQKPSVFLTDIPKTSASDHSLSVEINDPNGGEWNYTLETDHGSVSGALDDGKAVIENLHAGDSYLLSVISADKTTQYRKVSGQILDGQTGQEVSPTLTEKTDNQKKIEEVVKSSEPKTWLFLGDSITHGAAWTSGYDSCTQNFEKYLKEDLGRKDDVVINTAISGCTSEDHINDPDYRVKNYTPDVVIIMLGMNDFDSGMTVDTFKQNLKTIAGWCKEKNPDCQVILRACQSLSDAPADQAMMDALAVFCRVVNETAAEENWILVDHYKTWEDARKEQSYIGHSGYWNGNYAHPNGRGHQVMLRDMLEAMGLQNTESELYNMEYDLNLRNDTSAVVVPAAVSGNAIRVDFDEVQQELGSVIGKADLSVEIDGVTYSQHWSALDENRLVEIGNLPAFKNAKVHVKAWLKDTARTVEMNSAPLVSESALDREDLNALITKAKALVQEDYAQASWIVFAKALQQAEDVLANVQASQASIADAYKALNQAMDALQPQVDLPEAEILYDFEGDPLKDKAGNTDASSVGEASYESGYKGQAFTTGQAMVALGDNLRVGTDDFTLSYWIRVDKNVNDTALFSNKSEDGGKEKGVFIRNYNGIYVNAADGTNRYDTDLYDHDKATLNGNWHLLTAVFDRDRSVSLYVDGKLYNENTSFGDMASVSLDTGNPFLLGGGPLKDNLDGAIDEFRFYRAALDADQVQALYNNFETEKKAARENLKALQEKALDFQKTESWNTLNETLKANLITALDLTKTALADTSGAIEPCLNAYQQLNAALEAAQKGIVLADLAALAGQAEDIENTGYTQESWNALCLALENAMALIEAQSSDQKAIEQAYQTLKAAMDGLEKEIPVPDAEVYYDFEGEPLQDKAGSFDASPVGTAAYESGFKGQAFKTGSAYATIDDAFRMGTDDITISFWVRVDKSANNIGFFSNKKADGGTEKGVFMRTWNGVYVNAADGTTRSDTDTYTHDKTSLDGNWHMLTAVFDRDRALSLYVDGSLFIENTNFTAIKDASLDSGNPFIIGAAAQSNSKPKGAMDEFTIYRAALDAEQIQAVYDGYQSEKEETAALLADLQQQALAFKETEAWNTLSEDIQTAFNDALSQAEIALAGTKGAIQPLTEAAQHLKAATEAAGMFDEPAKEADRTLLNAAIAYARAFGEDDLKNLNSIVRKEFDTALEQAENLPETADQETVNQAWIRLTRAIQMLSFTSDKSELNALIAMAQALDLDAYKDSGKEAFANALDHAISVSQSATALDPSIQEAISALQSAMNALEPKAELNTFLLEQLVLAGDQAAEEDYTPSTWQNYITVLNAAKAVLEAPESQEQINAMVNELHTAWLNLRLKPSEELIARLQSFSRQAAGLDLALFSRADADTIRILKAEVDAALADPDLSDDQAQELAARIEALQPVIDQAAADQKQNASVKPAAQAHSVKTASSAFAHFWTAAAAAALGGLGLLKKRRNRQ